MYAIVFDLATQTLENTYPHPSWRNAYTDVRHVLEQRGFDWQPGSTYFGNDDVTAVDCVLAVQELKRTYNWFQPSVRDIRMLRIEENNDLGPGAAIVALVRAARGVDKLRRVGRVSWSIPDLAELVEALLCFRGSNLEKESPSTGSGTSVRRKVSQPNSDNRR